MAVKVRLFAGLRERAGWSEREIEAATVASVWPALDLGDEPAGLLYAVNKEYAGLGRLVKPEMPAIRSCSPSRYSVSVVSSVRQIILRGPLY